MNFKFEQILFRPGVTYILMCFETGTFVYISNKERFIRLKDGDVLSWSTYLSPEVPLIRPHLEDYVRIVVMPILQQYLNSLDSRNTQ